MSKSDNPSTEISRRALMQAATVLAVASPAVGFASARADDDPPAPPPPPPTPMTTTSAPVRRTQLFWTAETAYGRVLGMANGDVKQFKGIPYGGPTGGYRRFMPPRRPYPWRGVRDCLAHGPISPQTLTPLSSEYGRLIYWDQHPGGMGEDCLVLNVWTKSLDRSARKPVLVSFHGGGWASGSGNTLGFDGAMMAETHDVVVVTINHRLSAFGYLNLADLGAPEEFRYAGVAGVMDLAASLEWVQQNIESFGGDPGCVMIFGQSGGGAKTSVTLSNPAARGLFHRAAVQSGSALRLADRDNAARSAEMLLSELGIDTDNIAAIQRRSWQEILQAMSSLAANVPPPGSTAPGAPAPFNPSFSPIMDGEYLTHEPFDPTAPEESADIPVLISSTLHDAAIGLTNWDLDDAGLREIIGARFGEDRADAIIAAQKAARPDDSNYLIQAATFTDASRGSATLVQAERKAALRQAPVWVHQWDFISNMADGKFGAVHGIDVPPSFNNARDAMMENASAAGKRMSFQFSSTWAAFAKTGDPNNPEIPEWPAYDANKRSVLVWDREIRVVDDYRGELIRMLAPEPSGS